MNTFAEEITTKLAALGNTATDVAESLQRLGITGVRASRKSCPIYNYLCDTVPDADIEVGFGEIWFSEDRDKWESIHPPDAVSVFVTRFDDDRHYPELVAP